MPIRMTRRSPFRYFRTSSEMIRLAVILHRIWVDGTEFCTRREEIGEPAAS